jgi:hypothetical protein
LAHSERRQLTEFEMNVKSKTAELSLRRLLFAHQGKKW